MAMSPKRWFALQTAVALALAPLPSFGRTLIHAGTLIDGISDEPRHEMTVVVDGDRVAVIEAGYAAAGPNDTVVDLSNATVTPGWIDCHVHLDGETTPQSFTDPVYLNPGDYALRAAANARKTLYAGFTSVRNVGDRFNSTLALKRAIAEGRAVGPRIFTAGMAIGTTGGHADPTDGFSHQVMQNLLMGSVVDGPDEARQAVRQHYKDGVDLIKIMTSGGVLSVEKSADNPQMDLDEIRAIVTTAHEYGLKVAVHAHGAEAIRRSVLAGVDSIEHGTYMDAEDIRLMKEHGTFLVPTLTAGRWVAEKARLHGFFPELVRPKAMAVGPQVMGMCRRAYAAGIRIAFGTDTGVSEHGQNAQEFQYLVEAGLPPMKAIQCATTQAAALIGDSSLGALAPGKYADVVAVQGDLLGDIKLARSGVVFVMKAGVIYRRGSDFIEPKPL